MGFVIRRRKLPNQGYHSMPRPWLYYNYIQGLWLNKDDATVFVSTYGVKPIPGYEYEAVPANVKRVRKVTLSNGGSK